MDKNKNNSLHIYVDWIDYAQTANGKGNQRINKKQ